MSSGTSTTVGRFHRALYVAMAAIAFSLIASCGAPHATAQEGPRAAAQPSSAAPGETVVVSGTGWPGGVQLTARLYARGSGPSGPLADLSSPFETDASGDFSFQTTVPMTLLSTNGNRGNLYLVPDQYNLLVQDGDGLSSSTPFTVAAPRQGSMLWGEAGYDVNGDGQFDVYRQDARAGSGVAVTLTLVDGGSPRQATTDAYGRYMFVPIPAGSYTLRAEGQFQDASWAARVTVSTTEARATRINLALVRGATGGTNPTADAPAPTAAHAPTAAPAPSSPPEFKLGFATLAAMIPDIVGQPIENEDHGANGDGLQQTTTGLMVWRKADNWTAFTDGYRSWVNGPEGLQIRLNSERFDWEGAPR